MEKQYPYYLANKPIQANTDLEVTDKYTGEVAARVAQADADAIEKGIAAAAGAAEAMRKLPRHKRREILTQCVERFEERREELALALCVEAGKPIKDAKGEVQRLIDTFRIAAEEATRVYGEVMPMDVSPRGEGYTGMWKRVPVGPCSFISPFNFPLNLTAHKIAPAIAAGCPFVLKPASRTPVGALLVGEALARTDLPEGAFSILPCKRDAADKLTTDDRLKLLSFTGSDKVGWDLKSKAGKKKVVLELGGNAACIVEPDCDLDDAVDRIMLGTYYQSGQSCISVQRILIHRDIYDTLREKLVAAAKKLKAGNPRDEDVTIGPIISEGEAERIEDWIKKAVGAGGKLLCGGGRKGVVVEATLLEDVPKDQPAVSEEIFGPVAVLAKYKDYDEAIRMANDTRFGLQVGVFTRDIHKAHRAWDEIEVGGVLICDVPSFRIDHMPYGGSKDSGLGREGIRWAIEDMTEVRLLLVRNPEG